ncbi:MAG TPA: lysophospholipid acyltransferase family protein [Jiangellaceae bacterium]|nr:lysophospholipid acyltransferase family protein [Jiangellaceae bacterium]
MELVGPVAVGLTRAVGKIDVSGTNHLLFTGPAIVAVNHTTIVDVAPVLAALYRAGLRPSRPCGRDGCTATHGHVRFFATEHVFANPILGPLVRHAGFVPVGGGRGAAAALKAGLAALARGEIVGIFPEGDVAATDDGAPRKFRLGVSKLALESDATIIPVAHHDARHIGSGSVTRSLLGAVTSMVRRPTVRIRIGAPIRAAEYAGRTIAETAALIQDRVTAVWRSLAGTADAERQAG